MLKINEIIQPQILIIFFLVCLPNFAQVGIGTLNPTALLTVTEDAIFNESGGSFDFRVESADSENMFLVKGSDNRIGINNDNPAYPIHYKAFLLGGWHSYYENNNTTLGAVALFQNTNANNGQRVVLGATNYQGSSFEAPGILGMSLNGTTTGRGGIGVLGSANNERGNAFEGQLYFSGSYWGWAGYFNADLYCAGTFYGSDRRLKRDILPITNALDAINELEPVSYFYDTETYPEIGLDENRKSFGFIAQDLELIFPEMVKEKLLVTNSNRKKDLNTVSERETDLFKVVNYTLLVPILTQAIKEQQTIIQSQENRIQTLEDKVNLLESRLNQLIDSQN